VNQKSLFKRQNFCADFKALYAATDSKYLYLRIESYFTSTSSFFEVAYNHIFFDIDNNAATGYSGSELMIEGTIAYDQVKCLFIVLISSRVFFFCIRIREMFVCKLVCASMPHHIAILDTQLFHWFSAREGLTKVRLRVKPSVGAKPVPRPSRLPFHCHGNTQTELPSSLPREFGNAHLWWQFIALGVWCKFLSRVTKLCQFGFICVICFILSGSFGIFLTSLTTSWSRRELMPNTGRATVTLNSLPADRGLEHSIEAIFVKYITPH
jgi:hypothetical protein